MPTSALNCQRQTHLFLSITLTSRCLCSTTLNENVTMLLSLSLKVVQGSCFQDVSSWWTNFTQHLNGILLSATRRELQAKQTQDGYGEWTVLNNTTVQVAVDVSAHHLLKQTVMSYWVMQMHWRLSYKLRHAWSRDLNWIYCLCFQPFTKLNVTLLSDLRSNHIGIRYLKPFQFAVRGILM